MKRTILVAMMMLLAAFPSMARKTYLVSVGVSDYPGTRYDLLRSGMDAKTIQSVYNSNSHASARLLLNKNATKQNVMKVMKEHYSKATSEDIIVFFFSGHGSQGGFVTSDEQLLTYEEIRKIFATSKAKSKMIFADACYSGDFRNTASSNGFLNTDDVLLFLSSRPDEYSAESESMKNGFFTTCLQRCLRGAGDTNGDHIITAKELYDSVSWGVKQLSSDRQHPVMWGHFKDDMPIMTW